MLEPGLVLRALMSNSASLYGSGIALRSDPHMERVIMMFTMMEVQGCDDIKGRRDADSRSWREISLQIPGPFL